MICIAVLRYWYVIHFTFSDLAAMGLELKLKGEI